MRTEIGEQPAAIRATIGALLPRAAEAAALASGTRQVLFIARGTSDNAAVYGSYLIQTHAGRLATLASPSIATTYRSRVDLGGVLAVALSQSGQTEEIVETLAWARDCGAATLAITNGDGSPLAETADVAFVTRAGTERAVPATKTFTTQLAALLTRSRRCWTRRSRSWIRSSPSSPGTAGWSSPGAGSPTRQRSNWR
jgi:glucosamine--fructose-6-phosphate aminotransferase (isomerizing)